MFLIIIVFWLKVIIMIIKNLLPIINCFGYQQLPNGYDLLMFGLGSSVLIFILGFYYNIIPESSTTKSDLQNPIYQSKDILLQSKFNQTNYLVTENKTSTVMNIIIYLITIVVVFTPIYKLLGAGYFL